MFFSGDLLHGQATAGLPGIDTGVDAEGTELLLVCSPARALEGTRLHAGSSGGFILANRESKVAGVYIVSV